MAHLIGKDALEAKIEKVIDEPAPLHDQQCTWEDGYYCGLYKAENLLGTLEIKEVDLDEELYDIVDEHWWEMLGEEPVSENLEEVAHQYYKPNETFMDGFKKGAQWQKQKDTEALNENALLYNARLEGIEIGKAEMKQQMMKEAVEEEVIETIDYNSSSHHEYSRLMIEVDKEKFKEGDKVKLIIIKEGKE